MTQDSVNKEALEIIENIVKNGYLTYLDFKRCYEIVKKNGSNSTHNTNKSNNTNI